MFDESQGPCSPNQIPQNFSQYLENAGPQDAEKQEAILNMLTKFEVPNGPMSDHKPRVISFSKQ